MIVADENMNILVVDDMLAFRKIVRSQLAALGLKNVTEKEDGDDAWSALENAINEGNPFSLIICDWNMPRLPGIDLLERIRSDERTKELPFIMLTAEGEVQNVMRAIKLGVKEYIVKPFNGDQLQAKLSTVLKTAG